MCLHHTRRVVQDKDAASCQYWAEEGYCETNAETMIHKCPQARAHA